MEIVKNDVYMDDLYNGGADVQTVVEKFRNFQAALADSSLEMGKIMSNSAGILYLSGRR